MHEVHSTVSAFLGLSLSVSMFRATEPKVLAAAEVPGMKWNPPDTEGLVKFLVEEKSFNEDRVRKAAERINASRSKSNQGGVQKSPLGTHSEDCFENIACAEPPSALTPPAASPTKVGNGGRTFMRARKSSSRSPLKMHVKRPGRASPSASIASHG